jgi:Flp pilus assembly pilin Flp
MRKFPNPFDIAALVFVMIALSASTVFAGVMEVVKAVATAPTLIIGLVTVVLLYIMKAIPNDKIYGIVKGFFNKLGIACTLGLNRYPFTAPFWEAYVEPWFIDLLKNTVGAAVDGFIAGLQTNNKPEQ